MSVDVKFCRYGHDVTYPKDRYRGRCRICKRACNRRDEKKHRSNTKGIVREAKKHYKWNKTRLARRIVIKREQLERNLLWLRNQI